MPAPNALRASLPGLAAAAAAVVLCLLLNRMFPAVPVLTAAVLLGLLAGNVPGPAAVAAGRWRPGLAFSAKKFLRLGIVLLGLIGVFLAVVFGFVERRVLRWYHGMREVERG